MKYGGFEGGKEIEYYKHLRHYKYIVSEETKSLLVHVWQHPPMGRNDERVKTRSLGKIRPSCQTPIIQQFKVMFSIARNALRPTLTRAFGASKAFKHTLPPLPYAYNVCRLACP
jgi:hypothetical protein